MGNYTQATNQVSKPFSAPNKAEIDGSVYHLAKKCVEHFFQKRLQLILENLEGDVCMADNMLVFETDEENHNANLLKIWERCHTFERDNNIVHGVGTLSWPKEGLEADPEKVKTIQNLTRPSDVKSFLSFADRSRYLSRFLLTLADVLLPLRSLTTRGMSCCRD